MRLSPHPLTLRQAQYLVAVANLGSFRKAAEACHVSQPSLSAQVAQAEDALGVRLFDRDTRRVSATPAGNELLPRLRAMLRTADDVADGARQLAEPFSGVLRLGIIPTMGPYLLPHLAPVLRRTYPLLRIIWTEDKTAVLNAHLLAAELDAAVLALEADLTDVEHVVLGKDPLVFAAAPGHPLTRDRGPLRTDALDGQEVMLLDDGHCFREQALEVCARAGAQEQGFRATSLSTLVQMAAGGGGATLLPRMAVDLENRQGDLITRSLGPREPVRTVVLCWRRGSALGTTLRAVARTLKDAYEAHVEGLCLVPAAPRRAARPRA